MEFLEVPKVYIVILLVNLRYSISDALVTHLGVLAWQGTSCVELSG